MRTISEWKLPGVYTLFMDGHWVGTGIMKNDIISINIVKLNQEADKVKLSFFHEMQGYAAPGIRLKASAEAPEQ